jgi:membrane protease YdiL (CAAX protease family)
LEREEAGNPQGRYFLSLARCKISKTMASGIAGHTKAFSRLGIWALCWVVMYVMFAMIAQGVLSLMESGSLEEIVKKGVFDVSAVWNFRVFMGINQIAFIASGVFFLQLIFGNELLVKDTLRPHKVTSILPSFSISLKDLLHLVLITLALLFISGYLRFATDYILDFFKTEGAIKVANEVYDKNLHLLGAYRSDQLVYNLIFLAFLPAICEEYFFRKAFIEGVTDGWLSSKWLIAFFGGVIFSFFHWEFSGFLVRWMMGAVLTLVYLHYRNYYYTVIMHFLYNATGLISVAYLNNEA